MSAVQAAGLAVSAPGKAFLIGEYLALEGGPAVVTAIARRAHGRLSGGATPPPLINSAVRRAGQALSWLVPESSPPPPFVTVDTSAFFHQGSKIGIGSSAAATVVAVGLAFAHAGLSPAEWRAWIFHLASEVHRVAQGGRGSGADVAAATFGGLLLWRAGGARHPYHILPALSGIHLVFFWTGTSASTPALIEAVLTFARRKPGRHRALVAQMNEAANHFVQGVETGDGATLVEAARRYHALLDDLGMAAEVPIVTPLFREVAARAVRLGGAAKVSGAGGGDIGVALFADSERASAFRNSSIAGIRTMDFGLMDEGVRLG